MVRLQKILASAGVASRRTAERLIVNGRVTVNGVVVETLGAKADPDRDRITVDGRPIRVRRLVYVALNKPPGVLCTRKDESGRPIVIDLLPAEWSHLFPVGRLDRDSEGLLLLTNDGDFSLKLTHPRYAVSKIYQADITGLVEPAELSKLTSGVVDEGELLRADKVEIVTANRTRSVVRLVLKQGKNREVRRLFAALGREVERLQRLQIGPLKLGELKPGKWRVLTPVEVKSLLKPATPASTLPPGRPKAVRT
jgi:23S rRNA pseudouridine2605 synthase